MTTGAHMPMPVAPPGVIAQITGNDLLARLDEHASILSRIERTVDAQPERIETALTLARDNSARLAKLEQWRSYLIGIATVVVLLMTSGILAALITATRRGG